MSFFTKIKELFDKPETHTASGEWYYHTKVFSKKIILFYKKIITSLQQNTILKTGETIGVLNLSFADTTASVIKKWGNPRCSFKTMYQNNIVHTFFYRKNFVYESTLMQLQFYNNQLYFIGVEVGQNLMEENSKITMLQRFLPNFITNSFTSINTIPSWTDTDGNYLLVEDDVSLNICYLKGDFANENLSLLEDVLLKH